MSNKSDHCANDRASVQTLEKLTYRLERARRKRQELRLSNILKNNDLDKLKDKLQIFNELLEANVTSAGFDEGAQKIAESLIKHDVCDGVAIVTYDGKNKQTRVKQQRANAECDLDLSDNDWNDIIHNQDESNTIILESGDSETRTFHMVKVMQKAPWELLVLSSLSRHKILGLDNEIYANACLQITSLYKEYLKNECSKLNSGIDGLTKLNKKNHFINNFRSRIKGMISAQVYGGVILDVVGMGLFNKHHNMAFGDRVLQKIASVLSSVIRGNESVGRNSGDQFCFFVVAPDVEETILTIIDRVQARFKQPIMVGDIEITVKFHIGYVICNPEEMGAEECFNCAELAVKQAKSLGASMPTRYENYMLDNYFDRFSLEHALTNALNNNEYVLHYQPIIDLKQQSVVGVEALIRWKKGEGQNELVSPNEFIPMLEQSGLIIPVGRWLIKQALQDFKSWQVIKPELKQVCINMSAKQFSDRNLHLYISESLDETGLSAECLNIEVTETAYLETSGNVSTLFNELSDLGADISLDDFGTGYSSLSYLHRYPVSRLKIDRMFIKEFDNSDKNRRLLQSIIALSKSMGMNAVAEGIEDERTASELAAMGVEFGQGFHFSRPVDADQFKALLVDETAF